MSNFHHAPTHDHWPRLSETLPHAAPDTCASCGLGEASAVAVGMSQLPPTIHVWQEHDWQDRPEARYVALCEPCADRLIEKHPRLYARLERFTPAAGAMTICTDCVHRKDTTCHSPRAHRNGGEGILVTGPKPHDVHVCRSPRRHSGWIKIYPGPPMDCTGREVAP